MYDKTITINGFSKCYAMTGFRLGYLAAPLPIAQACNKIQGHITSCPCSVSQVNLEHHYRYSLTP
jgi:aspartate/methionine/tyrosine aminotransferase